MFQPDPDHPEPAWVVIREVDSVVVEVGTPQLLLAMKLHAARGRRDFDDITVLIEACGVTTVQEAEALFEALPSSIRRSSTESNGLALASRSASVGCR